MSGGRLRDDASRPDGTDRALDALRRAARVTSAALHGYSALGPRLDPGGLELARAAYDALRLERDAVLAAVAARGTPPPPPAAPSVPVVHDIGAARGLALALDDALASAYVQLVRDAPELRGDAARWLGQVAARAVGWRVLLGRPSATVAWPGLTAPA